jgi:hypothetical protein
MQAAEANAIENTANNLATNHKILGNTQQILKKLLAVKVLAEKKDTNMALWITSAIYGI